MKPPGIEPRSPRPLANTLLIWSMGLSNSLKYLSSKVTVTWYENETPEQTSGI